MIAYHTQGRVIYWSFQNYQPPVAYQIAQIFARASGYTVATPPPEAVYAGYKDWFIQEYRRPGYTMEVGIGRNPIPISQFNTIYGENEEVMLLAPIA